METRITEVEPFRHEHADGVVSLILPIQQAEFGIPITLQAQPDLLDIPGFYQHDYGNFWVALEAGEVIGSVALLDIRRKPESMKIRALDIGFRRRDE